MRSAKWICAALILILGGIFLFSGNFFNAPGSVLQDIGKEIPKAGEIVKEIRKEAALPPPLRVKKPVPVAVLTREGIISQTNLKRKAEGEISLTENSKLDQAAARKVADMFSRQYFAHESPTGGHASDLVTETGYQYLSVGENLALGNFSDDKDLGESWMNSPGHRANILDAGFMEIGAAAERGVFEGEKTWLAVQIFALPQSACPQTDENLKLTIDSAEKQVDEFTATANALKAELEAADPKTKKEVEEYNQKVHKYNALAKSINSLIDEIKTLISKYNAQVRALNECAAR